MSPDLTVRQARADDREAVVGFTADTWLERGSDYIPRVFDEWVATDGPTQRTFVAAVDGSLAGICQGVLLSDHEAWAQGMRVAPDHRGRGVSPELTHAVFDWARERGATVCRNMVFQGTRPAWASPGRSASSPGRSSAGRRRPPTPTPRAPTTCGSSSRPTRRGRRGSAPRAATGWRASRSTTRSPGRSRS